MFEKIFGRKVEYCVESNTDRDIPEQTDAMDKLIKKLVPKDILIKNTYVSIGSISSNNRKYYIIYSKRYHTETYELSVKYYITHDSTFFKYNACAFDLPDKELCSFINEHFDEIVKLLQEFVNDYRRKEEEKIDEETRYRYCQEKLRQKVNNYCNRLCT